MISLSLVSKASQSLKDIRSKIIKECKLFHQLFLLTQSAPIMRMDSEAK